MSQQQQQEQTTIQRKSDLQSDIQKIHSQVEDGLAMGDSMFGKFAHADVTQQVNTRIKELEEKKAHLEKEIKEKESLIQRSNRDFSDVKDSLPETLEKQRVKFIEDYTIMFLSLTYIFMILSALIYYVMLSQEKMQAFLKGLGYSLITTIAAGILLYLIA